jgi:1-deoxy-D-xylulose-5-phosphate synthase
MLQIVPGIRIAAPRDEHTVRAELREAVSVNDAPTVIRFPKGSVPTSIPAVRTLDDGVDVLHESASPDVLIVGIGAMVPDALRVAEILSENGVGSTVVDPRWVIPVPASIIDLAARHRIVVSIEDGIRVGGVGTRIRQDLRAAGVDTAVDELGLPDEFLEHDTREHILERVGLTPQAIAANLLSQLRGEKVPHAKPLD